MMRKNAQPDQMSGLSDRQFARRSRLLSIAVLPSLPTATSRIVVAKSIVPQAVQRNALKRKLRAIVRQYPAEHSLLIRAQRPALSATYAELVQDFIDLVGKPRHS